MEAGEAFELCFLPGPMFPFSRGFQIPSWEPPGHDPLDQQVMSVTIIVKTLLFATFKCIFRCSLDDFKMFDTLVSPSLATGVRDRR
jgi:hypothetical protein